MDIEKIKKILKINLNDVLVNRRVVQTILQVRNIESGQKIKRKYL